jgi:hypothetical protein
MRRLFTAALLALALPLPAAAQSLLASYTAYIGQADLYNSNGQRLTEPWQVLRQDRANFHRFRIRQPGDQGDRFFASADNRAAMERMLMNGTMEPGVRQMLLAGGAIVFVNIYGSGGRGDFISVTVAR